MNKNVIIALVAVVIIAGGSFYAGTKHTSTTNIQGSRFQAGTAGALGMRGMRGAMGGFTGGEIIAKDDTSITVKMQSGGSKIIFLSDTTKVMKEAAGKIDDLAIGTQVSVTGATNTDGSVNAQTVQIRSSIKN